MRGMRAIETTHFFVNNFFHLHHPSKKHGQTHMITNRTAVLSISAKKTDLPENSQQNPIVSTTKLFSQSAIALFAFGFIDAGYSGDWSRIGAITKESEELLKLATFVVIPFCVFLIISVSKQK